MTVNVGRLNVGKYFDEVWSEYEVSDNVQSGETERE